MRLTETMACLALSAGAACGAARADVELDRVREMLRLDTEQALAAERARRPAPARPARPAHREDRLVLASLYGLDGALNAIVMVNGSPRFYRQGESLPRGTVSAVAEYSLLGIKDGCVRLRKGSGRERAACFDGASSLPVPQPEYRAMPAAQPGPRLPPALMPPVAP